jgi:NtrC-family two-component system response regulator AlgB
VAAANGGTIFLDEIGELPLEIQPKLLRLLQEKQYERVGENKVRTADLRILAATNRDLEQLVKEGRFREDLFFRLNVISVRIPPLRERRKDLVNIADSYLKFFAQETAKKIEGFTPAALEKISTYSWPGNLRELRNVIERAVILCEGPKIDVRDLPENIHEAAPRALDLGANATLEELEAEHIRRVIAQSDSLDTAAKVLGIHPATLYRKRKRREAAK